MKILKNKYKMLLVFIPVAYFSVFFHEVGHWTIGEMLGNDLTLRLNGVSTKNGGELLENTSLYLLCGGVGFTLLLTIIFWGIIEKYKVIYAYPVVFFNFFFRLFPQIMNFDAQDEAKISMLLGIGKYTVAIIVIISLFLMTLRAYYVLKLNYKENLLYLVVSLFCTILVVITDLLLF